MTFDGYEEYIDSDKIRKGGFNIGLKVKVDTLERHNDLDS